jgi:ASC-1-like (ASCH) protein
MKLSEPWYQYVQDGVKIYEGRRYTDKVAGLKPGDIIEFQHATEADKPGVKVIVEEVLRFSTFEEALNTLPVSQVLPIPGLTVEEGVKIYLKYVSLPTQIKDGVCMIRITLV